MYNTNITIEYLFRIDDAMEEVVDAQRHYWATKVYYEIIKPFYDKHGLIFVTERYSNEFYKNGEKLDHDYIETLEGGELIGEMLCQYFQDELLIDNKTLPFLVNAKEEEERINRLKSLDPNELPF